MLQRLSAWLLFNVLGFTIEDTIEKPNKYIIALAPHTSNWDFIIGQLYAQATGLRTDFLMKREWFFWPLSLLWQRMGGIPVFREKNMSMTDAIAQSARKSQSFRLCITPEGTRKRQPEWKKGFYYIALKAEIPILLYGLDYGNRRIVCTRMIMPTGDVESELTEIKRYFDTFKGKHPENFTTGL